MTKMFYATDDHNDGLIHKNATIFAFATREEAEAYLKAGFDPEHWDFSGATIESGRFGDCWIKVHSAPDDDEHYFSPFTSDDLIILPPGQHPGGKAWWISPRADVLVLTGLRPVEG